LNWRKRNGLISLWAALSNIFFFQFQSKLSQFQNILNLSLLIHSPCI
jgi:hypothetical protein